MIDFRNRGQLEAIIEELESDIKIIDKAIKLTKRNQNSVNHSVYQGRIEAYEGARGLLAGSLTNYKYELEKIKK